MELMRLILGARAEEPAPEPELVTFEVPQRTYDSMGLEQGDLDKYVGQFPSAGGKLEIARYEGGLLLRSPVFGNYRLFRLSPTEFFLEDMEQYAVVEFSGETPNRLTIHATRAVAELYDAMVTGGIEAALDVYRRLEDLDRGSHAFTEGGLNRLGYELLRIGESAEAIEIFKLNIQAFPSSFNVYDSLGEAYMTHGDYELAVENYVKSLELNPQNGNAEEKLEELHQLMDKH
jgi:tetratricopeptide (TPR) repeat protein